VPRRKRNSIGERERGVGEDKARLRWILPLTKKHGGEPVHYNSAI